jgi:SAM-dependent methyltransferase
MGLGYSSVQLYLELWKKGLFRNASSAVDMGSQELHITVQDFEKLLNLYGVPGYKKENFPHLENWPAQPRCSARHLYELFGVKEYACIDLNREFGAIPHDLNLPLEDKSLYGRFDIVTDHGCNEHVFNTSEAYRTVHRLCKPGGMIIAVQIWHSGNGLYTYEPAFFECIAAANDYSVLRTSIVISLAGGKQFHLPLSEDLLNALDRSRAESVGLCYVFQKTTAEDFRIPSQGNFLSKSRGAAAFQTEVQFDPPRRTYVPVYTSDLRNVSGTVLLKVLRERFVNKLKRIGR